MTNHRTPAQLRKLLFTKLAVDHTVAAEVLNIGMVAMKNAIERKAAPVVDLGPGNKKKPIPTSWLREQLGILEE